MPKGICAPHHIEKYDGHSNPKNWFENYQLAMKSASAPDPYFMVQYILISLADSARAWLDNLEEGTIRCWKDFEHEFHSHFEGAYTKLGSAWKLAGYLRKKGATLRDYVRCFT
jgi:hypothetical protein